MTTGTAQDALTVQLELFDTSVGQKWVKSVPDPDYSVSQRVIQVSDDDPVRPYSKFGIIQTRPWGNNKG